MAIAYASSTTSAVMTSGTMTMSYTCTAGTKLLVMGLATETTTLRIGGAPTYNSVAMAQVQTAIVGSAECTAEMWYLANPSTASAYNVIVPNTGSGLTRMVVSNYTSTEPVYLNLSTSNNVSMVNPTLQLGGVPNQSMVVDILGDGRLNAASANTGGTVILTVDEGVWNDAAQYKITTADGTTIFTWVVASDDVAHIMASFSTAITLTSPVSRYFFMVM